MTRKRRRPRRTRRPAPPPRPSPAAPPPRSARAAGLGALPSSRRVWSFAGGTSLLAAMLGALTFAVAPWVGRWFAVVPRRGRIVVVEEGRPVVLVDDGAAEPVRVVAHGSYTPGDPWEVTVRHVPFVPEAAVMGNHVPLGLPVAAAVLLCLAVLAVWAPRGLRASWLRRRRARPRLGRVGGAELRVPVALRAGAAAVLLLAGAVAGVLGSALAAVSEGLASAGPFLLICLAWLLVPAGAALAVGALYLYAERAPVKARPAARVLRRGAVRALRAAAVVTGCAGGLAAVLAQGPGAQPSSPTATGTAAVVDAWSARARGGDCLGRALVDYTVAGLPYRTTLDVECGDLPLLEAAGEIRVRWPAAAPEHAEWVR
ncbi:hypothetical protein ACFVWN_07185 [Nocardiopsis flavescens]|uniref:hypothetical protein n=1 Tax=Nocardiopsis flavescens TaxID=758803 RepID=UPI0036544C55